MEENEFVIFAELERDKFEEILARLMQHYPDIQSGRQGDDWIWVHFDDDKVEIDSFTSMQLEVKAKRRHTAVVQKLVNFMEPRWVLQVFDPPKEDLTR